MLEMKERQELREQIRAWKRGGHEIALVPTMGNLHEGHLALVRAAGEQAGRVVVSIYVNPTQFGAHEDFAGYPKTPETDRESLRLAGCDLLFSPNVETVYPHGLDRAMTLSAPPDLASILEGEFRPDHFNGVVTVVLRLFNLVDPDVVLFGEKDYQQLLIIQRMIHDLGYAIRIHALPTVREGGGLALSSRNNYLDSGQKRAAESLFRVLQDTAALAADPGADLSSLEKQAEERLNNHGLKADYVAIRRANDLGMPREGDRPLRILAAVWCGETRLIDNLNAT
jgi:pantoate--beta-alanine ligase